MMGGARPKRVTNGQRAAICALRLAGVPMAVCCRITDASVREIRHYIGPDWFQIQRPPRKWRGRALAKLRKAYCDPRIPVDTVAEMFCLSRGGLRLLVIEHGWPRRDFPRDKSRPSRSWKYRLVREITGDRQAALAAIGRTVDGRTMRNAVHASAVGGQA